jgi:Spy/CpxP family protein refolding chaperone
MTSLINLLIASFLTMNAAPASAQAATAVQEAPPAAKDAQGQQKAAFKEMLDETQKINELCTRDHFGKACIAAQEQFQRKFLKQVPKYDPAVLGVGATLQAKQGR